MATHHVVRQVARAEDDQRARPAAGPLGLDLHRLRTLLSDLGVAYVDRLPDAR